MNLHKNRLHSGSTTLRRTASVALTGMAIVALFAMLSSKAMADSTYRDRSIRQSTGQNGAKLKWLPYRPSARMVQRVAQNARKVNLASYQDDQTDKSQSKHDWQLPPLGTSETKTLDPSSTPLSRPSSALNPENISPPQKLPEEIRRELERKKETSRYEEYQVPVQEEMAEGLFKQEEDCPSEHDFKPIDELTDKVHLADGDYPKECKLPWQKFEPREWESTQFTWKASGLCHNPLYFEDVQLERYGHSWGPYIQPVISQGHFFVTVPFIPYKMGLNPPRECLYSLGYYRPGNCAPYMIEPIPLSVRAGLAETAAVMGGVYLYP